MGESRENESDGPTPVDIVIHDSCFYACSLPHILVGDWSAFHSCLARKGHAFRNYCRDSLHHSYNVYSISLRPELLVHILQAVAAAESRILDFNRVLVLCVDVRVGGKKLGASNSCHLGAHPRRRNLRFLNGIRLRVVLVERVAVGLDPLR